MQLDKEKFRSTLNGKSTDLFLLTNSNGLQAYITNYGARVVSLICYDKANNPVDIVVGFDSLEGYLETDEIYHGAIIGRYANRIKHGRFSLNGQDFILECNNGPNHLHGGPGGFHNAVWDVVEATEHSLRLKFISADGEEGYPGQLTVEVMYELTPSNELSISYTAESDQLTILNITNHAYFNLNGQGEGDILNHLLQIAATNFTPIDDTSIPFGEIAAVSGTPFDFTELTTIGSRIDAVDEQLKYGSGYDHNFVLTKQGDGISFAAKSIGDRTGITLEAYTTEPGVQLYTGNFMQGKNTLKYGKKDEWRSAFCLETQHYPDSPNNSNFPPTVLLPEQTFSSQTTYRISLTA